MTEPRSADRRRRERHQTGVPARRSAEGGPEARRGATTPSARPDGDAQQAKARWIEAQAHTLWEEGREPGRQVVALGVAVALTVTVVDVALTERVSLFFDLCFVALCVGLALAVRPTDFFTVGVLPPVIMIGVFLLLGSARPEAIAHPDDGVVQAVVSGLSHHSGALVAGYILCLATLAYRQHYVAHGGSHRPTDPVAHSNRAGSPAPRRTTSG